MKKPTFMGIAILFAILVCTAFTSCAKKDDGQKVKLVYWSMWNQTEAQGAVFEKAIRDFEKKNPGVAVEINWNGREIRKTLQPALDNNQTIDLWDEDFERVVKNWGAYALKLDDYAAKTYPATGGKSYETSVMKSLLDQTRKFSADGSLLAITYQPFVFAFMYNKEHFTKAGITSAPKTWAELEAACAKLKAAGYDPLTTDDAYVDTLIGYYLARAKGSDWVAQLVSDKTNKMWDDPAVLQMAKAFEDFAKKGYFSKNVMANKWPAGQQDVAAGNVSMYLNGTWLVNEIMGSTGPDFPWGAFSFPTVPNGVDGTNAANFGGQAFQINKKSANPDVAFDLIVHLTTGEWDKVLAQESYGVPVSGTTEWPKQLTEAKDVFAQLNTFYPWAGGIQTDPNKQPVIAEGFTRLIGGQLTAQQFIAAMKK